MKSSATDRQQRRWRALRATRLRAWRSNQKFTILTRRRAKWRESSMPTAPATPANVDATLTRALFIIRRDTPFLLAPPRPMPGHNVPAFLPPSFFLPVPCLLLNCPPHPTMPVNETYRDEHRDRDIYTQKARRRNKAREEEGGGVCV